MKIYEVRDKKKKKVDKACTLRGFLKLDGDIKRVKNDILKPTCF